MRLFHNREVQIPQLPALTDLRDEQACAGTVNQCKFEKKAKANQRVERLDTSPLELEVGLDVVMRDPISKCWDIPGTVVSIRPGGLLCYVKTAGSNRTYLRNRQLLWVDTAWQVTEEECYEVT